MIFSWQACLFDLDGVIVDTAKYHYLAWREIATELGIDFTEHDNERLKGVSRMRSLDILLDIGGVSLDANSRARLAEKKNTLYLGYISGMRRDEVLPGAREFVVDCKMNGLKTGLGSASKNAFTILDRLHLTKLFDVVVDGNKAVEAKPAPQVFLMGAEALRVPPRCCVVFEDAEAGIEAAKNAGMMSIGIGSPAVLKKATLVAPGLSVLSVKTLRAELERRADRVVDHEEL